jgi:hypothetical protein
MEGNCLHLIFVSPGICLEGLRKTTKKLSQDIRSPGYDLNLGPHSIYFIISTGIEYDNWQQ